MKTIRRCIISGALILGAFAASGARPAECTIDNLVYTVIGENEASVAVLSNELRNIEEANILPEVTIEEKTYTVTKIGDRAFYSDRISNLKKVNIPSTITIIGNYAFMYCYKLTEITLPSSIKEIGDNAFAHSGIKEMEIPTGIKWGSAPFATSGLESVTFEAPEAEIPDGFFSGCQSLKSVVLRPGLKKIGNNCFSDCKALQEITLPEGLLEIGNGVFAGSGIKKINFPESLQLIGDECFAKSAIETLALNEGVRLGEKVFNECKELESITLPSTLTEIPLSTFENCSNLRKIDIPDAVTFIGKNAFNQCSSLAEVKFGIGLTEVQEYCFYGCNSLREAVLPPSLKVIPGYMFYDDRALQRVVLPEACTEIGEEAFGFCEALKSVSIPREVEKIADHAFYYCSGLEIVNCYALNPPVCGEETFGESYPELMSLRVPEGSKGVYEEAPVWKDFGKIEDVLSPLSVEEIETGNAGFDCTAPYEVYDLNGILRGTSLHDLPEGIYILRQGNTSLRVSK